MTNKIAGMPIPFEPILGEIWKPVVGYNGLYEVSNIGRVKRLLPRYYKEPTMVKARISPDYWSVKLVKLGVYARKSIHVLVATSFIPNPENKKEVNHINGDKLDNRVENLEWATRQENNSHYINVLATGNVMTDKKIEQLYLHLKDGGTIKEFAAKEGFTFKRIREIAKGQRIRNIGLNFKEVCPRDLAVFNQTVYMYKYGVFIQEFGSLTKAAQHIGKEKSYVFNAIKTGYKSCGYNFSHTKLH